MFYPNTYCNSTKLFCFHNFYNDYIEYYHLLPETRDKIRYLFGISRFNVPFLGKWRGAKFMTWFSKYVALTESKKATTTLNEGSRNLHYSQSKSSWTNGWKSGRPRRTIQQMIWMIIRILKKGCSISDTLHFKYTLFISDAAYVLPDEKIAAVSANNNKNRGILEISSPLLKSLGKKWQVGRN